MGMKKKKYKLTKFSISYVDYGEFKGSHIGTIEFEKGHQEKFIFKLSSEKSSEILNSIAEELGNETKNLISNLMQEIKQIKDGE